MGVAVGGRATNTVTPGRGGSGSRTRANASAIEVIGVSTTGSESSIPPRRVEVRQQPSHLPGVAGIRVSATTQLRSDSGPQADRRRRWDYLLQRQPARSVPSCDNTSA